MPRAFSWELVARAARITRSVLLGFPGERTRMVIHCVSVCASRVLGYKWSWTSSVCLGVAWKASSLCVPLLCARLEFIRAGSVSDRSDPHTP